MSEIIRTVHCVKCGAEIELLSFQHVLNPWCWKCKAAADPQPIAVPEGTEAVKNARPDWDYFAEGMAEIHGEHVSVTEPSALSASGKCPANCADGWADWDVPCQICKTQSLDNIDDVLPYVPAAEASPFKFHWDAWLASEEAKTCLSQPVPIAGEHLENRLWRAFTAGWNAIEPELTALRSTNAALEAKLARRDCSPKVICLCGSTRFTPEMLVVAWEFTKQRNIVLTRDYSPLGKPNERTASITKESSYRGGTDTESVLAR